MESLIKDLLKDGNSRTGAVIAAYVRSKGLKTVPKFETSVLMAIEGISFDETVNPRRFFKTGAAAKEDFDDASTVEEQERAAHVNPPVTEAERVVLIDLENQHAALGWSPNETDYVVGFVCTSGMHVFPRLCDCPYVVEIVNGIKTKDLVDCAILWHLAKLKFEVCQWAHRFV
jgi:hypothetical protein